MNYSQLVLVSEVVGKLSTQSILFAKRQFSLCSPLKGDKHGANGHFRSRYDCGRSETSEKRAIRATRHHPQDSFLFIIHNEPSARKNCSFWRERKRTPRLVLWFSSIVGAIIWPLSSSITTDWLIMCLWVSHNETCSKSGSHCGHRNGQRDTISSGSPLLLATTVPCCLAR